MADVQHRKRRSLRNSVLRRHAGSRSQRRFEEQDDHEEASPNRGPMFGGLKPFFHENDDDIFSSFGFGGVNPFGDDFNKMMENFFSDFNPESFADSRYYSEDRDLDSDISREGLDRALDKRPHSGGLHSFSSGFSHSESIITRPDGSVERKVTRKDAAGNVETKTTITRPDGTSEVIENNNDLHNQPRKSTSHEDTDLSLRYDSDWEYGGFLNGLYDRLKNMFRN